LVGQFEVGWRESVFLLGLADQTRLVFDCVDCCVELWEDEFFRGIFGAGTPVAEGRLQLLQPYFPRSLGIQKLENGKKFVFGDISCEFIDIIQIEVAFAFDVNYLEQGL